MLKLRQWKFNNIHLLGAIIGWDFVSQHADMVYKYIMMGAPSQVVYNEIALTTLDQFKRSWYVFCFKMPYLPEKLLSAGDYNAFFEMWNRKFTQNFTEDDLETYKYVFSRSG